MPASTPHEAFEHIARLRDDEIDLAVAALAIGAPENPTLDVGRYLARLDDLAEGAQPNLDPARDDRERIDALNHFLFVEQRFRGNVDAYDDPRNSFLDQVLDRRLGIPITLSVVYIEVAARLGMGVEGIGFPGHFLVKHVSGRREIVVDPFFGRILTLEECGERLSSAIGRPTRLEPDVHLRAASRREILERMLRNLKHIYARRGDFARALTCAERVLLLTPDAPLEVRDRGLFLEQLECHDAAAKDLARFLVLAPGDPSAPSVRARLEALRRGPRRLH